jgi:hypothetical protein
MPPHSNIIEGACCGSGRPPMGCAVGPPSPRSNSIEMELAIALTNANINSGRVIVKPVPGDQGGQRAAGVVSASVPANMFRRGMFRGCGPFCVGSQRRTRSTSDAHVVWSRPLEIQAGPGYSPASGATRPCNYGAEQGLVSTACVRTREQHVTASVNSAAGKAAGDAGANSASCRLTARSPGRLRVELCSRLGLVDLSKPETWPASGLPQSAREETEGAVWAGVEEDTGGDEPGHYRDSADDVKESKDGSKASPTDSCRSWSVTPVSSWSRTRVMPVWFGRSFPVDKNKWSACGSPRGALCSGMSPEAKGFLQVAGGYF